MVDWNGKTTLVTRLIIFLCLSAGFSAGFGKNQNSAEYIVPNQVAEIPGAAEKFATAQRACENFAWAASVQTLLHAQQADMPQQSWVDRAFGGNKCIDSITNYPELMKNVDGDYALDDGRKIRVRSQFSPGPPLYADPLIVNLRDGRPMIVLWNSHPYLLYGVLYDVKMGKGNLHTFFMRELRLVDPLIAPGKEGRTKVFTRDKDDANQINGLIQIFVTKRAVDELSKD